MYLHIGKDIGVNIKDIIGIFNIETLNNNEYKEIIGNLDKKVLDISDGKPKAVILTIENNEKRAYISNILSITLEKRAKTLFKNFTN